MEHALACDIIIASEKARLGLPEAKIGAVPGSYGIIRLHQIVGRAKAKELMMTGEHISAEEALHIGLVSKVVPHEKLIEEAVALASKIAANPPLSVRLIKSAVNRELVGESRVYASSVFPILFATEDLKEGITAFREKRQPVFKGK